MQAMKYIAILFLATASIIAAEVAFDQMSAKSDGKVITVEWRPTIEKGIRNYELERASSGEGFHSIAVIEPKGAQSTYRYIDENALMKGGNNERILGKIYSYRIKVIAYDNSASYSNIVSVSHSVSGIRRTWGMIKEMFR
ncbi:MAG: hypothetical protein EBU66_00180 [Bacteroidetes bacterium]|nr:hypothetical protein [bacterium]NBP63096.1 hypothetical protein [Bacteroidota bacterium]